MDKQNVNFKFRLRPEKRKEKRKGLIGSDCSTCQKYYEGLNISMEDKQKRIQNCSKHKDKYIRSLTPENFWSIEFPEHNEEIEIRPLRKLRK